MAGYGDISTSQITNDFIPMIVASRDTEEHTTVMKGLTSTEKLEKGRGDSAKIPVYGALDDADDLSEGVDVIQSHSVSDSLKTITPTEIGIKVVVTKRVVDQRRGSLLRKVGELAGAAMGRKEEKMGLTMLDGFSSALGSAGTALTWEHISAAEVAIRGGGGGAAATFQPLPKNIPVVGVFHPHQLWLVAKDFAPAGTYPVPSGLSEEIMKSGRLGNKVGGVPIFEAGLLTIDASDDAKGGIFGKDALISVWGEREEYQDFRGSLRAYEITQVQWLTYFEYEDNWGRECLFDAVMPVS